MKGHKRTVKSKGCQERVEDKQKRKLEEREKEMRGKQFKWGDKRKKGDD